jgi:hypothetical protein
MNKPNIKIVEMPVQFHCTGMMNIIKKIIRGNIPQRKLSDVDIDTLMTEYAKLWYFHNVKNAEVVDSKGRTTRERGNV